MNTDTLNFLEKACKDFANIRNLDEANDTLLDLELWIDSG